VSEEKNMIEAEWLTCTDPRRILGFLRDKGSDRKLRLFAAACCRLIWYLLKDERSQKAVEIAEQFADEVARKGDLDAARQDAYAACSALRHGNAALENAAWAAQYTTRPIAAHAAHYMAGDPYLARAGAAEMAASAAARGSNENDPAQAIVLITEFAPQCVLLRDIFGNPFRPVGPDPALRMPKVTALAQAIYDDRLFDDLPILADALEEAGCTNTDILAHCRGPGQHARGCWVVDLVLGLT
jgi:hypothetical protein